MSLNENPELKAGILNILAEQGVLAKVKAFMRAQVWSLIHNKQVVNCDPDLAPSAAIDAEDMQVLAYLVRWLQDKGLWNTIKVLELESGQNLANLPEIESSDMKSFSASPSRSSPHRSLQHGGQGSGAAFSDMSTEPLSDYRSPDRGPSAPTTDSVQGIAIPTAPPNAPYHGIGVKRGMVGEVSDESSVKSDIRVTSASMAPSVSLGPKESSSNNQSPARSNDGEEAAAIMENLHVFDGFNREHQDIERESDNLSKSQQGRILATRQLKNISEASDAGARPGARAGSVADAGAGASTLPDISHELNLLDDLNKIDDFADIGSPGDENSVGGAFDDLELDGGAGVDVDVDVDVGAGIGAGAGLGAAEQDSQRGPAHRPAPRDAMGKQTREFIPIKSKAHDIAEDFAEVDFDLNEEMLGNSRSPQRRKLPAVSAAVAAGPDDGPRPSVIPTAPSHWGKADFDYADLNVKDIDIRDVRPTGTKDGKQGKGYTADDDFNFDDLELNLSGTEKPGKVVTADSLNIDDDFGDLDFDL